MKSKYKHFLDILKKNCHDYKEEQIKIFDDGWDKVAILLGKTIYAFPRNKNVEKLLSPVVLFTQEFSKISPVKIPVMTLHIDSITYITYQFINGVPLTKEIFKGFTKEKQMQVAKELGQFLKLLHTFPLNKALKIKVDNEGPFKIWSNELDEVRQKVYPVINEFERQWIESIYSKYFSLIKLNPPKLKVIHSDMQPEHIIVDIQAEKLSGIIDFGDLEISDPAYDFCVLEQYYGKEFLKVVYQKYNLEKDKDWDTRIKFYIERKLIGHLKHSLKLKDKERIKKHKKRLQEYIKSNKLISLDYNP